MDVLSVFDLKPGAKVDMRYLMSVNRKERSDDDDHFVSGIHEVDEDGIVELEMPMRGGKAVLVPMGLRYEFIFTMNKRLYRAEADIVGRFRKNGFSLLKARITSKIEKFQRREYYRLDLLLPLDFITLDERAGDLMKMADIRQLIDGRQEDLIFGNGTIVNISGGGVKFTTETDLNEVPYIFMRFAIETGGEQRIIALIGQILHDIEPPKDKKKTYRVRTLYKDSQCQEQIIRFIFETERKIRKKELGE